MSPSKPYIAGFFDGEGSIGIYSRKDRAGGYCLRTQLTQNITENLLEMVEKLKEWYGGSCSYQTTLSGNTKINWQLSSDNAANFLDDILPFLILKREQAMVAIEFQRNRPTIKRNSSGEIQSHSIEDVKWSRNMSDKLKELKQPLAVVKG